MSLITELKRRNVFKVTAAYAVVGWLIAQIAEFATSTFGAPPWVLRTFVLLLLLGLPMAVILAWAFNLTPEGVKRAADIDQASKTGRGTNWIAIGLLAVVLAAAVVLQFWMPTIQTATPTSPTAKPSNSQAMHVDLAFTEDVPLAFVGAAMLGNGRTSFALSPDGQRLVYMGGKDGEYALYIRDLRTREVRKLGGTENGYNPFFSPNGRWIAFFEGNQLKRVAVDGGNAVRMTEATNSVGGTWLGNDAILAVTDEGGTMLLYSTDGKRSELTSPSGGTAPFALPGGTRVLLSNDDLTIAIYDTVNKEQIILPVSGRDPRFISGFLFYNQGDTLYAARFDPDADRLLSTPVPVKTGVRIEVYGFSQWSLASNGTFLYAPGYSAEENPLTWVNGAEHESLDLPQRFKGTFEISPDGQRLAVAEFQSGSRDVWLYDFKGTTPRKLTVDSGNAGGPLIWMPDGKEIIFHSGTGFERAPFRITLDSAVSGTPLLETKGRSLIASSISQNGRYLGAVAVMPNEADSNREARTESILVIDLAEGREMDIPTTGEGNWGVTISPDGRFVAYTSPVSGQYQNYLQPVPPTGARYQVSRVGGAEEPRWSRDGSKLYYRSGQRIMVVDVQASPEIVLSEPRVFFEGGFVNVGGRSYEISPDGSRALVISPSEDTTRSIHMVTNWLNEVERMVSESGQ